MNTVNGKTVINFSVAHSEKYRDSQNNMQEKTIWPICTLLDRSFHRKTTNQRRRCLWKVSRKPVHSSGMTVPPVLPFLSGVRSVQCLAVRTTTAAAQDTMALLQLLLPTVQFPRPVRSPSRSMTCRSDRHRWRLNENAPFPHFCFQTVLH